MADTVVTTEKNGTIQIAYTGAGADWVMTDELTAYANSGIWMKSIQFHPSTANDVLVVNEGGIDGPSIMHVKCSGDTDDRIKYFEPPKRSFPAIDLSDCTFGTAASVKITIELA